MTVWWRCMSSLGHDCCQVKIILCCKGSDWILRQQSSKSVVTFQFYTISQVWSYRVSKIQHRDSPLPTEPSYLGSIGILQLCQFNLFHCFHANLQETAAFLPKLFVLGTKSQGFPPQKWPGHLVLGVKWVSSDISVIQWASPRLHFSQALSLIERVSGNGRNRLQEYEKVIKVRKLSLYVTVSVIFWKSIQTHTALSNGHILGIGRVGSYICCVGWTKDQKRHGLRFLVLLDRRRHAFPPVWCSIPEILKKRLWTYDLTFLKT